MAHVSLIIPGVEAPREVDVGNVTELMGQLDVPEGYEIRLLRESGENTEVLEESSELHDGDQIRVQPVLKGA